MLESDSRPQVEPVRIVQALVHVSEPAHLAEGQTADADLTRDHHDRLNAVRPHHRFDTALQVSGIKQVI